MRGRSDVIYTWTDEAPMLATHSLLPIVEGFTRAAGVSLSTADISLAGRILAAFGLAEDDLAALGALTSSPRATIIKLPNISASLPQLKAAIAELRARGHELPDYPDSPSSDAEREARARYDAVKGSAVNPVLREGNSDRRAPRAVKAYVRSHPHAMGAWSPDSRTRVATMEAGDFRHNERSVVVPAAGTVQIRLVPADGGEPVVLRESLPVTAGEVVDATCMSAAALDAFLAAQVAAAKDEDILFSIHLKATMMKVSDPLIFGHAVRAALPRTFAAHGAALAAASLRPGRPGPQPTSAPAPVPEELTGTTYPDSDRLRPLSRGDQPALASDASAHRSPGDESDAKKTDPLRHGGRDARLQRPGHHPQFKRHHCLTRRKFFQNVDLVRLHRGCVRPRLPGLSHPPAQVPAQRRFLATRQKTLTGSLRGPAPGVRGGRSHSAASVGPIGAR